MIRMVLLCFLVLHTCAISSVNGDGGTYAADIILLIDNSRSVKEDQMQTIQDTIKKLPNYLNISSDGVHVGIVAYASRAIIELPLTCNESVFMNHLTNWRREENGATITYFGYQKSLEALNSSTRSDVPKHIVLLTDGESSFKLDAEAVAKKVRSYNISIFILYVGTVNNTIEHMEQMAGNPAHVYALKDYEKFLDTFKSMIEKIVDEDTCSKCTAESCPAHCITTEPPTTRDPSAGAHTVPWKPPEQQPTDDPFQSPDNAGPAEQQTVSAMNVGKGDKDKTKDEGGAPWGLIGGLIGGLILLILIIVAVLIAKKIKVASASASKQSSKGDSAGKKQMEKVSEKSLSDRKSGSGSLKGKLSGKEKAATGSSLKDIEQSLQVSLMDVSSMQKSSSQGSKKSDSSPKVAPKDAKAAAKGAKAAPKEAKSSSKAAPKAAGKALAKAAVKSAKGK